MQGVHKMANKEVFYYFHHDLSKKDKGGIEPIYTGKNLLFLLWWVYSHTEVSDNLQIDRSIFEVPEFTNFHDNSL